MMFKKSGIKIHFKVHKIKTRTSFYTFFVIEISRHLKKMKHLINQLNLFVTIFKQFNFYTRCFLIKIFVKLSLVTKKTEGCLLNMVGAVVHYCCLG